MALRARAPELPLKSRPRPVVHLVEDAHPLPVVILDFLLRHLVAGHEL